MVSRRGQSFEHRCPLDAHRELAWAAIDLAADGFTVETPAVSEWGLAILLLSALTIGTTLFRRTAKA